jgi:hypothetical protein
MEDKMGVTRTFLAGAAGAIVIGSLALSSGQAAAMLALDHGLSSTTQRSG